MRNPFKHEYTEEQVDAAYAEHGWGTRISRRAPRSTGDPLYFEAHLPSELRLVEVSDLAAAAGDPPAWLGDAEVALRQANNYPGTLVIGAICPETDLTDVQATLTVVFSEEIKDPGEPYRDAPERSVDELESGDKVVQRVVHISDTLTVVQRVSKLVVDPDEPPRGLIVQDYLLATDLGGLSLAFSSTHSGAGRMQEFFMQVVKGVVLSEDPPSERFG